MPTSADAPDLLVDTSVAVAAVVADHQHHDVTVRALGDRKLGLAGHAAFETYSVLTRLPPPARRAPAVIAHLLETGFPGSRYLSNSAAKRLFADLASHGITGGSVYDALVAAAAKEHQLVLATRDRRALDTYRALGVQIEVVPDL